MSELTDSIKKIDSYCLDHFRCNLVAWETARHRDNEAVTNFIKFTLQQLEEKDEQIKELDSIEREHHYLISKIDKLFGKNKGEHNYFDTIVRVRKQLKESNELLKEACKYLQQETDLGKQTANSYGVDYKMFCYYDFLNKPEVKNIMEVSDEV